MSSGWVPSNSRSDGEPSTVPSLADAFRSVKALAAGRFEVLGPLGSDLEGGLAFLARDLSADRLVVLKRSLGGSSDTDPSATLKVIQQLDASVPPPAGACPVCQIPLAGWDPSCSYCNADLAGSIDTAKQGLSPDELLAAVKEIAHGCEVLGAMPRAAGGAPVYFARELEGGTIVALRLDSENAPGQRSGFTVVATRMLRPNLSPSPPSSWDPPGTGQSGAPAPLTGRVAAAKTCPQCNETFGPELRFCPNDGSGLRGKAPPDDLVGQVIAERYHILAKLGEGGMGMVYLAEHVRMGRRCAIKVMHAMLLFDPDSVSRFNREAANASRITHPNVAAIYDFGETGELLYLAMELVEGESLSALLRREPGLSESRAIEIGLQVADALGAAHALGIVHRDLKPDNIMVARTADGRDVIKVVDFGIAKATKEGRQTVTRTGFIVGTPAYMSPEQILGDVVDGRSDLYSMGCILYEMLTAERAFLDAAGEVSIRQRLTEPPPQPSRVKHGLSGHLDRLVTTAMAREPGQRFQSAAEVRDALIAARNALSEVSWRSRLPWRRSRRPAAALPLGEDDASRRALQRSVHRSTVVQPRTARSSRRNPTWLVVGCVITALTAYGTWRLFSPDSQPGGQSAAADSQIVLPAVAPPPSPEPVSDTTPSVVTTSSPTDSAATGTLHFPAPLPPDARITVDGAGVSFSADGLLSLAPGRHFLRVEAAGYQPFEQSIDVATGKTEVIKGGLIRVKPAVVPKPTPATTSRAKGTILLRGTLPPGAEISLDGETLPVGTREIPVEPGSHWLKLSAPGYRPDSSQIEVRPGSKSSWLAPQLTAIPRLITVEIATGDTTIPVGSSMQLRARARDDTGADLGDSLVWESSNAEIARVERDGRVTARRAGRAYIRASTNDRSDSTMVTVVAAPKPVVAVPRAVVRAPPVQSRPVVPAVPSSANIQAAVTACAAAMGSRDERRIVQTYQAKTAQDVMNLRKILEVAIKREAGLAATATTLSAPSSTVPVSVDAQLRFTWRNNAGVNKKKDTVFRVELTKAPSGWELAACRATGKVGF